jgi:DNA repair protein RecO (recombination protein O)
MVVVRDRALLLRRYPYSESSLVAQVCTREHGRVHLIAKGAYRPTSRYFAVLDYFDTLELEWDHNPQRELSTLRSGAVRERRPRLCQDLACFRAAMGIIELTDLASRPAQTETSLYDLLEAALERLQQRAFEPNSRALLTQIEFELAYLRNLGLEISLELCAACGGPAPALGPDGLRAAFSGGAGGRLCGPCAEKSRASGLRVGTMSMQVLEDARLISSSSSSAARSLEQERDRLDRVRDLVERFLDYHLETRPRMHRAFLAHPNRNAQSASPR